MGQKKEKDKAKVGTTPLRRLFGGLSWFEPWEGLSWREVFWVAFGAALIFLPFLGSFGLWDPWETHYGEVGRQITERQDWISLWWGSHWEGASGRSEGGFFFSKPVLLMWMMALGIEVLGVNPWAIRLGVALTALVGVVVVYAFGASVFRRRTGLLMAGVVATSPFWAMLSRQAQTDMPFVGTMTIGMCFFMMAIFGRDREEKAGRLSQLLTLAWIGVLAIPQLSLILMGLSRWRGPKIAWMEKLSASPLLVISLGGGLVILAALLVGFSLFWRHAKRRRLAVLGLLVLWGPLVGLLLALLSTSGPHPWPTALLGWFIWGPVQVAIYASCLGGALYWTFERPKLTRRRLYLYCFYIFIALATLAKGLLGFMLPGAVLFLYLLITREWRLLKDVELFAGTLLFIAVAFPWYAAMLIRHHPGFWNRFFVHDHFRRLGEGVHALTSGSFEHFIRWLGYGLFPWSAFIPAAVARLFSGRGLRVNDDGGRATLMLFLWALVGFTLFSLSSTTFHHYIFPVVPALAMLVALALDDLLENPKEQPWALYVLGAGLMAVVAWDMIADPQNLKNLYTYRYDREWDHEGWDGGFQIWLVLLLIPLLSGALVLLRAQSRAGRQWAMGLLFGGAVATTLFCLNIYMPTISSTMSQGPLWERYYELCDRVEPRRRADRRKRLCRQPAIGFKLNWRGETYHTSNEIIPIRSDEDWEAFLEEVGDETFYGIMQHSRYRGEFTRKVRVLGEEKACLVHDENLRFALVKYPCAEDDPARLDKTESQD